MYCMSTCYSSHEYWSIISCIAYWNCISVCTCSCVLLCSSSKVKTESSCPLTIQGRQIIITSERLRTFSPDLLQNVLSYQCIIITTLMGCSESVVVDKSIIDFPIFLLFFNTKFPIFSILNFLFSYFFEQPCRWTPWRILAAFPISN